MTVRILSSILMMLKKDPPKTVWGGRGPVTTVTVEEGDTL